MRDLLEMDTRHSQAERQIFTREGESRTLLQSRRDMRQGHAQRIQSQAHHQVFMREGESRTVLQPRRDMLQGHAQRLEFHVEIIR